MAILALLATTFPAYSKDMIFPEAEWSVATPESVMIDSQQLQQALDRLPELGERYIIVRNGHVIAQGSGVDETRHLFFLDEIVHKYRVGVAGRRRGRDA